MVNKPSHCCNFLIYYHPLYLFLFIYLDALCMFYTCLVDDRVEVPKREGGLLWRWAY